MVSAAVTREGHCSERESTQGGVVVGGPLQCWEEGDVFADSAALFCSRNSLPPEGWRWGAQPHCAVGGGRAVAGVPAFCTAVSCLALPA